MACVCIEKETNEVHNLYTSHWCYWCIVLRNVGWVIQRVVQVRPGGHVRRRGGLAAGVDAFAAAARAHAGRRPPHLWLRAALLRPSYLLCPLRHQRPRGPHLRPHILGHAHHQLNMGDCRRYDIGERFLTFTCLRSRMRLMEPRLMCVAFETQATKAEIVQLVQIF